MGNRRACRRCSAVVHGQVLHLRLYRLRRLCDAHQVRVAVRRGVPRADDGRAQPSVRHLRAPLVRLRDLRGEHARHAHLVGAHLGARRVLHRQGRRVRERPGHTAHPRRDRGLRHGGLRRGRPRLRVGRPRHPQDHEEHPVHAALARNLAFLPSDARAGRSGPTMHHLASGRRPGVGSLRDYLLRARRHDRVAGHVPLGELAGGQALHERCAQRLSCILLDRGVALAAGRVPRRGRRCVDLCHALASVWHHVPALRPLALRVASPELLRARGRCPSAAIRKHRLPCCLVWPVRRRARRCFGRHADVDTRDGGLLHDRHLVLLGVPRNAHLLGAHVGHPH
mmetsp:Transcript_51155/g.147635  ORF Transcript_51155/g.147635 Transcript_51155/m.147635 type:complete len:339 (-) Transcript_51155:105-1121(-)